MRRGWQAQLPHEPEARTKAGSTIRGTARATPVRLLI